MRTIPINFRWPVRQTSPFTIEVQIPTGPQGVPILNTGFIEQNRMTDAEIHEAEFQVLRAIAILPEGVAPPMDERGPAKAKM